MNKLGVRIVALIAVVGALIGTYFILQNRPEPQVEVEPPPPKPEISRFETERIMEVVLESPERTLVLTRTGDTWTPNYPYPVTLDDSDIDSLLYSFSRLYAETVIEEQPTDLSVYGLDPPQQIARARLDDGSETEFYLGDRTPTGNTYYLQQKDEPTVYSVWMNVGNNFSTELTQLRETSLPGLDSTQLTYVRFERLNQPTIEIDLTNPDDEASNLLLGRYVMTEPWIEPRGIDANTIEDFFAPFGSFQIDRFVDDGPTNLAEYGLDPPQATITARDVQREVSYQLGFENDGETYFMLPDSNEVWAVETRRISGLDVTAFSLSEKFALIVTIDYVENIVIETPTEQHTITIEREGDGDDAVEVYRIDGVSIDEDPFKDYYQSLIGLIVDAAATGSPSSNDSELTIVYNLNYGIPRSHTLRLLPFNRDFVAAERNGSVEFLIDREQPARMLEHLRRVISESG